MKQPVRKAKIRRGRKGPVRAPFGEFPELGSKNQKSRLTTPLKALPLLVAALYFLVSSYMGPFYAPFFVMNHAKPWGSAPPPALAVGQAGQVLRPRWGLPPARRCRERIATLRASSGGPRPVSRALHASCGLRSGT